jgi:hypothetical protein
VLAPISRWTVVGDEPIACAGRGLGALEGRKRLAQSEGRVGDMLWTLAMVMVILWLLGMVSSYTMNGLIHILLVVAVIAVLIRLIQGRRVA